MAQTKLSSREFNQDISRAKRAADDGPVIITDRGQPAYVLLRHEAYKKLSGEGLNIRQLLCEQNTNDVDVEFEAEKIKNIGLKPVNLE